MADDGPNRQLPAQALSGYGRQLHARLQDIIQAGQPSRRQFALGLAIALLLLGLAVLTGPVLRLSNHGQQNYQVDELNFFSTDWPAFLNDLGISTQARSDYFRIRFAADGTVSQLVCTAYEPAVDPGDNRVDTIQIHYDAEHRLISVQRHAIRPSAANSDPAAVLTGKSSLARLLFLLTGLDWAAQLADFPYAWVGMACDGDNSLGTKPDDTFLVAADGSLRPAEAGELPLPSGTVLALYGLDQPSGPSAQVFYYYLAARTAVGR